MSRQPPLLNNNKETMALILDGNSLRGAHKYLLFDPFKAFDYIESSLKSGIFTRKDRFSFMRAQHVMSYHLIKAPWKKPCILFASQPLPQPAQLLCLAV